jgi:hypothetical protein
MEKNRAEGRESRGRRVKLLRKVRGERRVEQHREKRAQHKNQRLREMKRGKS